MYAGKRCPGCAAAKQWLDARGVRYEVINIDGDRQLMYELTSITGQRSIPQFFLDRQWLSGGMAQVRDLYARGQI